MWARWIAIPEFARRNISCYNAAGTDHGAGAYGDSAQDGGIGTNGAARLEEGLLEGFWINL